MNNKIRDLLAQISALEEELLSALHERESHVFFTMKGRRIQFEQSVKQAHRRLRMSFFRWLTTNRPQNLLTAPIIYSMIVPLLILDFSVSLYQLICFPIYKVVKVRRRDYIVWDHQHLEYLNFFQKIHCNYCAYGTGLLAYTSEIVARTEQYFCPIKHARKVLGTHARYQHFLDYGDPTNYEEKLEEFRVELDEKKTDADQSTPPAT